VDPPASPRRFSDFREWILSWLAFPDLRIGWYRPAVREGSRLIAQGGIDVVISSSPPIVAHLVAGRLARTHQIPWIMDFRDPWFTDGYERPASRLMRHLQGRLLRRSASRAAAIVGNTPALCRSLAGRLGATGPRTVCIRNGAFALDAVAEAPEYPSEFRIAHVGNLVGHRTAAAFLRGLRRWMDRERDHGQARVRFVGSGFVSDHRVLDDLGLRDVVTVSPRVPRREALELMAEQWVLLLLANDQPLQVPGKAYEYLATGRRILAVTEREGSTAEVLGGEPGCQVAEDEAEVAQALDRFFREYRERAPGRFDRGPFLASNSYAARAAVYADLIRSVAASGDAETRGAIGGD
jgi:glycosyltransferase involved in cell wall biosynthesis